jgi:hypothetical protein
MLAIDLRNKSRPNATASSNTTASAASVFGGFQWPTSDQICSTNIEPFFRRFDTAPVREIVNVSQRQGEANIHHDGEAKNLGTALKVIEGVCFRHAQRPRKHSARLNPIPSVTPPEGLFGRSVRSPKETAQCARRKPYYRNPMQIRKLRKPFVPGDKCR